MPTLSAAVFPSISEMLLVPGVVAWKNLDLKYIGASQGMINKFGFKGIDEVIGSTVYDIKCPMVECADDFMTQDRKVIKEKKILTVLDIHPFAEGISSVLLGNRMPLINSVTKEIIGTIYSGIQVNEAAISALLNLVILSDKSFYGKNKQRSYTILDSKNDTLTAQEKECLFFLLRGFTAKNIAKHLTLSSRTIESHIANIKRKFNCNYKNELIEKAIHLGYMSFLPKRLLLQNISLEI